MVQSEENLVTRAKVWLKSMPLTWVNPCVTMRALCFCTLPSGPCLTWKTHLLPTILWPFGLEMMSYTSRFFQVCISFLQAASHSPVSGLAMALSYVFGLEASALATLA